MFVNVNKSDITCRHKDGSVTKMPINLLIVESPAKCKKIQEILGSGWRVKATMGHIRALKEDLSAIGFRTTWTPTYEMIATKAEAVAALRREVAGGAKVFLGSDDDREGEAIAWHTCMLLGLDPLTTPRVTFHEITESAIKAAVESPSRIDMNKFNAQQARTMLDMLIGFTLSPCLWRGIGNKPGLSAGRCQTPALRIIYDRDQEIAKHTTTLSWEVKAHCSIPLDPESDDTSHTRNLTWTAKESLPDEASANAFLSSIPSLSRSITVQERKERTSKSAAPLPFITSTLQQEASNRFGMNPKVTMKTAQTLYEAGLITYMRTDNAILSEEAKEAVQGLIMERWGEEYIATDEEVSKKEAKSKSKGKSKEKETVSPQAAHEGIRPTHIETEELADMGSNEQRLYELIWRRTVQSQMASEKRNVVKLTGLITDHEASPLIFVTEMDYQEFAGWQVLDAEKKADDILAEKTFVEACEEFQPGVEIPWESIVASEKRSSPPSRYTEASLIRELESRGIGRPSTYATLVETVLERGYIEKTTIPATPVTLKSLIVRNTTAKTKEAKLKVEKESRVERSGAEKDKLRTTSLGRTVIEWLLGQFPDMITYELTAEMETALDEIAKGKRLWQSLLSETWERYEERYDAIMAVPKTSSGGGAVGGAGTSSPGRFIDFGDGYKMVVSKKGPLFVLESSTGEKTRFASVPSHLSLATATRADAEVAFKASAEKLMGESLGDLNGQPVIKKSGKFGAYVTWKEFSVHCKASDTLEEVREKLLAKEDPSAVDRLVGEFRIRKGPYGLYMFKVSAPGSTKKPVFVNVPEDTPWATLTPESAASVYRAALAAKKEKDEKSGHSSTSSKTTTKPTPKTSAKESNAGEPKKRAPRKKKEESS